MHVQQVVSTVRESASQGRRWQGRSPKDSPSEFEGEDAAQRRHLAGEARAVLTTCCTCTSVNDVGSPG
jgi:hypothetical protein